MKKFGKIFGIAALAVATLTAGAFGLSGCGGNKVKVAEVEKYVASETTVNQMNKGVKINFEAMGMKTNGAIVVKDDGKFEMGIIVSIPEGEETNEAIYQEMYVKEGFLYQRASETGRYTKTEIDDEMSIEEIDEYVQMTDLSPIINEYVGLFKKLEGYGLKLSKSEKNGVLEYNFSYKTKFETSTMTLVYTNDQLTKLSVYSKASYAGETMGAMMIYEYYEGEIDFPEDLDSKVEIDIDGGDQEELEEAA